MQMRRFPFWAEVVQEMLDKVRFNQGSLTNERIFSKAKSGLRSTRQAFVPSGQIFSKHGWQESDNATVVELSPYGPLRAVGVGPYIPTTFGAPVAAAM
jgi:hypothetical protein